MTPPPRLCSGDFALTNILKSTPSCSHVLTGGAALQITPYIFDRFASRAKLINSDMLEGSSRAVTQLEVSGAVRLFECSRTAADRYVASRSRCWLRGGVKPISMYDVTW